MRLGCKRPLPFEIQNIDIVGCHGTGLAALDVDHKTQQAPRVSAAPGPSLVERLKGGS